MKIKLFISSDRVPYLQKQLDGNIKILGIDDDITIVEIEIHSSYDVLLIFHAGIEVGKNEK